MTKSDFIKAVATKTGISQKDIKDVLAAEQEVIFEAIPNEEVKVFDGVTIYSVYKEAREARNPQTGETVPVAAKYQPKAKFGKAIKDAINA